MALTPPFAAGATITAASLAAVAPLAGYKYADQGGTQSSTVLQSDTDLVLPVLANGVYTGYGLIAFSASAAANFKATLIAPAGASGGWSPNLYLGTGGGLVASDPLLSYGSTIGTNTTGIGNVLSLTFQFTLLVGATPGTLQYQFAQFTSDATQITSRAGSFLLAWKIA